MNTSFVKTGGALFLRGAAPALVLAFLTLALAGCAGYKANLSLAAVAETEELGKSAPVAVSAEDVRKNPVVCKNSGAMGMASEVTLAPGLEAQLARTAGKLLAAKGFDVSPQSGDVARKATVELVSLACENRKSAQETVATARAALLVKVDNNGHQSEARYEAETVWRLKGENIEPDYDRLLSQTISKALARLGADYDFLNDLAAVKLRSKDLQ